MYSQEFNIVLDPSDFKNNFKCDTYCNGTPLITEDTTTINDFTYNRLIIRGIFTETSVQVKSILNFELDKWSHTTSETCSSFIIRTIWVPPEGDDAGTEYYIDRWESLLYKTANQPIDCTISVTPFEEACDPDDPDYAACLEDLPEATTVGQLKKINLVPDTPEEAIGIIYEADKSEDAGEGKRVFLFRYGDIFDWRGSACSDNVFF